MHQLRFRFLTNQQLQRLTLSSGFFGTLFGVEVCEDGANASLWLVARVADSVRDRVAIAAD